MVRYDKTSVDDPELTHVEAGVLAFRRSVLELLPDGVVSLENEIFPRLIERGDLIVAAHARSCNQERDPVSFVGQVDPARLDNAHVRCR